MVDIRHKNIRKNSLPRTGREIDAVGGTGSSSSSVFIGGGGSVTVEADFDILAGSGIDISKSNVDKLTYTVSHSDTSDVESIAKKEKRAIAGVSVDGYGHIVGMETCKILSLEELDERYLFKYGVNDTEKGFITFEKGFMTQSPIRSAEYNIGWEEAAPKGFYITETGTGWFTGVNVRGPLLCNDVFGSPYFASGWTGFGTQLDFKKSALELDFLTVRKSAKFYELVVNQIRGTNGSLAVTDTNQIETVEEKGDVWRCVIDDMDGQMYMNLRPGDVIRCQKWGKTSGRYYMGLVTAVGDDWFEVDKTLLEGEDAPAPKDVVVRWSNLTDEDRKGLLYLTSSDSYNPYLDIRYGDWNATAGSIKVRLGRLDGINDPLFPELYGGRNNFGLYTTNFYGTGELILRSTGESVSRTFEVLKDSMTMGFNEIREEVYVSPDNILQNATFLSESLDYWETADTIYPYTFGSDVLVVNGSLFSNVVSAAQIVSDELNNRKVLQVSSTQVRQRNANFNSREAGKYTISFSYRPIVNYGALSVGIENSDFKVTVPLKDTAKWQRAEITGDWDGTGDFIIEAVGGIANIVDISFADDRLTNTISKLKVEYDTKLSLKADGASLTTFRSEYDEFNREIRRDYATQSWTADKIKNEVGTEIDGKLVKYSTITQTSDMIEHKVADLDLGQYATTTWTSSQIESKVESYVDGELVNYSTTTQTADMIEHKVVDLDLGQYATISYTTKLISLSIKNKADKSDLKQTAEDLTISFENELDSLRGVTSAFYEFSGTRMRLNRRIELGTGSNTNFTNTAGMSPDSNDPAFWAGNTGGDPLLNSRIVLNHDGSGWLASKNIIWENNGQLAIRGRLESGKESGMITIDPDNGELFMTSNSYEVLRLGYISGSPAKVAQLVMRTIGAGGRIAQTSLLGPSALRFSIDGVETSYITSTGMIKVKADVFPTAAGISSYPVGTLYRDGNTIKIKL